MTFSLNTAQGRLEIPSVGSTVDLIGAFRAGTLEWSTTAISELHLEFEDRRCDILRAGALSCGTKSGSEKGTLLSLGGKVFEVRSFEHRSDGTLAVDARGAKAVAMRRSERGTGTETTNNISPSKWVERVGNWYGLRVHAQETPVRDQVTRQGEADNKPAESDWDVCQRLAGEEGMVCFEADGVLSFGKPSYLMGRPGYSKLRVEMKHDPDLGPAPVDPRIFSRPAPRRSSDSDVAVASWSIEVDASLAMGLGSVGFGAQLIGYAPQFDGEYLVTSVQFPLDDQGVATLTCSTPVDPAPTGQVSTATAGGTTGVGVSSGAIRTPGPGRYATTSLDAAQMLNATTIVKVGLGMGVPTKGLVVAIATALQESTLKNLNYGDRDSLGLFQQRPSMGWGTPQQVQDPAYAARKFFEALLKVSGWQSMAVTVAAQAVQRSGFPQAYAKWQATAEAVVAAVLATGKPASSGVAAAPSAKARAVAFARAQIGKPYVWGGVGPGGYDCSGLVQAAYKAAGFALPRTTYQMASDSRLTRVSLANLQAGDLWLCSNNGHVQLVSVGNGAQSTIIEAATAGVPIVERRMWTTIGEGRRVPV